MLLEELQWANHWGETKWSWNVFEAVNIAKNDAGYFICDNASDERWVCLDAITAQAILFHLAEKYGCGASRSKG